MSDKIGFMQLNPYHVGLVVDEVKAAVAR